MKKAELAYIAGFLDGDGCIMLQLVYRRDYIYGYQIRASIVFYQNQRYRYFLEWLKSKFINGYIRNRNDGMAEYTIVGVRPVLKVLKLLQSYIRLKKKQVEIALNVLRLMPGSGRKINPTLLLSLSKEVDKFAFLNYSRRRTNTSFKVEEYLRSRHFLDPVETEFPTQQGMR